METLIRLQTPHLHHINLTFFGFETCCTYSIAGLSKCNFFDIKTFIGGRPLSSIFKPIESSSEQKNPLVVAMLSISCVCMNMSLLLLVSLQVSGCDLASTLNPMEKEKPVPLTSAQAPGDECQSCQHTCYLTHT